MPRVLTADLGVCESENIHVCVCVCVCVCVIVFAWGQWLNVDK